MLLTVTRGNVLLEKWTENRSKIYENNSYLLNSTKFFSESCWDLLDSSSSLLSMKKQI